jgi:hypothetical protein
LLVRVGLDAPTSGGAGLGGRDDRLGQPIGVDDTDEAQRSPEGVTSLRQRETGRVVMQMSTPS